MTQVEKAMGNISNSEPLEEFINKSRKLIDWEMRMGEGETQAGSLVGNLLSKMRVLHLARTKRKECILKDTGRRIQGLRS